MPIVIYRDNFCCLSQKFLKLTGTDIIDSAHWGQILEQKYVNNEDIINKIINEQELNEWYNSFLFVHTPLRKTVTYRILYEIVQQQPNNIDLIKKLKNKDIIEKFSKILPILFFNDIKNQ